MLFETSFPVSISVEEKIIDRQIEERQTAQLDFALQKLTVQQKEIIYYFYYENLSHKEISELMGFTHVRSARNLLYEILDKLKNNS